jgi:hypothetical protein
LVSFDEKLLKKRRKIRSGLVSIIIVAINPETIQKTSDPRKKERKTNCIIFLFSSVCVLLPIKFNG